MPAKDVRNFTLAVRLKESVRTPLFRGNFEVAVKSAQECYPNNSFNFTQNEINVMKTIAQTAESASVFANQVHKNGLDRE